jgi:ubiquinone/menaquinone biosynthesis C-methylase UbiE
MFHPDGPTLHELAAQALSSTERGYDLLAPKFDYTPFRTPDAILRAAAESLPAGARCDLGLDLCCGTGAAMEILRPLCRKGVVGLDFSAGVLSVARRNAAPGGARVHYVRGNALALPFGPVFDVVVCFGALGHILRRDQLGFVSEVARVLRPGGRFVFVSSYMPPVWSARRWLARGFNAAMHVRNALVSPPFVMYYLTFLLPEVQVLLDQVGLEVDVRRPSGLGRQWGYLRVVTATRPRPSAATPERRVGRAAPGPGP